MTKKIAIIGAAGYLGAKLVDLLAENGHKITAITRQNGEIMLGRKNVKIVHYNALQNIGDEKFDAVVNLAYSTSSVKYLIRKENDGIREIISMLSTEKTKIIHTSTIAVFGFSLDREVKNTIVKNRADYPYIYSKISMENLLQKCFPKHDLSILRLGNIWGPASASWTVKLADNLLYEKPVACVEFGYSNITDVFNTADYIRFLIEEGEESGHRFYHLAELGNVSWEILANKIASALNTKPVFSGAEISQHKSLKNDLEAILRHFSPSPFFFNLLETRFLSFYLRNFIAGLPRFIKKPFNTLPQRHNSGNDTVFLTIMSGKIPFPNITDPRWNPPVDIDESLKRVFAWMKEAGYLINEN